MKRTEPRLCQSITKKPGWGGAQAPGPIRLCAIMSLPTRSWNVPQSQKLNMAEVKLKKKKNDAPVVCHQPHIEGAGLEEVLPIVSSPRQKLKSYTNKLEEIEAYPLSKT